MDYEEALETQTLIMKTRGWFLARSMTDEVANRDDRKPPTSTLLDPYPRVIERLRIKTTTASSPQLLPQAMKREPRKRQVTDVESEDEIIFQSGPSKRSRAS